MMCKRLTYFPPVHGCHVSLLTPVSVKYQRGCKHFMQCITISKHIILSASNLGRFISEFCKSNNFLEYLILVLESPWPPFMHTLFFSVQLLLMLFNVEFCYCIILASFEDKYCMQDQGSQMMCLPAVLTKCISALPVCLIGTGILLHPFCHDWTQHQK